MKKQGFVKAVAFALALAALTPAAFAKSVLVATGYMDGYKYSEFEYKLDSKTELVDLELTFARDYTCGGPINRFPDMPSADCYHAKSMVVSVPGLKMDRSSGAVILAGEGSEKGTVCAVVKEKKNFFGWTKKEVVSTGLCTVRAVETSKNTDVYYETVR